MSYKKQNRAPGGARRRKALTQAQRAGWSAAWDKLDVIVLAGYSMLTADDWVRIYQGTLSVAKSGVVLPSLALMAFWALGIFVKSRLA